MAITPIKKPLPAEELVALSPETASEAAMVWLARPNLFAGRALTAPTLQRRQRWQAGRLALRGQSFTAGVVRGLEVGHEILPADTEGGVPRVRLTIAAGLGLAASGEDVLLARPAEIALRGLPVYAAPSVASGGDGSGEGGGDGDGDEGGGSAEEGGTDAGTDPFGSSADSALRARAILAGNLGTQFDERPDALPRVGVLVLQPIEVDRLGEFDPTDPCELGGCGEDDNGAFEDWRIADGVRAVWYAWPVEWNALPADDATLRNRLAWAIFSTEAALAPGELLPWEMLGVPVALIALDENLQPRFIDHAAVVRLGGRSRHPRLALSAGAISAGWRRTPLWQAQIEQLAEHIAAAGDPPPPATTLATQFAQLPPAGLLPINAIDLSVLPLNQSTESLRSAFFPGSFLLDVVPVPIESLDLAIREAAPLAPIRMSEAERVRVLVPVPQAVYDPCLLHEEVIDPEFQATLERFLVTRAAALGARQGLRIKASELARLITGRAIDVPAIEDDPLALEAETLAGWGPPPAGGGHRGALAAGLHQHFFTGATAPLAVSAGDALYAWTYLDPDHPPRVLMLQWNAGNSGWEHRAYWAAERDEHLIPWGTDGSASRLRIGTLPDSGRWLRLEVPAAALGLEGTSVSGMAFTLYDGRAAFGPTGRVAATAGGADSLWFASGLPEGAVAASADATTETWTFLPQNDLNAPFESAFGLEPNPSGNSPVGLSPDIEDLLADPALAEIAAANGQVTDGVLSAAERGQLAALGVQGFIAYLKARADRADDLIDYGFVKVQTDTYRMRQLILGTTAATRLAVSPALASIARAETAVASQERISSFFDELKITAPSTPAAPASALATPSSSSMAPIAARMAGPVSIAGIAPAGGTSGIAARSAPAAISAPAGITVGMLAGNFGSLAENTAGNLALNFGGGQAGNIAGGSRALDLNLGVETLALSGARADNRKAAIDLNLAGGSFLPGLVPSYTPKDVTAATPLVGKANIRTTSIAERMAQPKALEAKDYSTATRHDSVLALLRFADELRAADGGTTPGLFAGINVYGLANDPFLQTEDERTRRFVPLTTFITSRARLSALLQVPDREGDESVHFSDSADLADNTVALIRQVEGRVQLYREAIRACERVLAILRAGANGANAAIAAWEGRLAEARHDVGVARALIAEEKERLGAINARRAAVLRDEVRYLAYIRPREAHNLAATPAHALDPGLLEAPVPACLAQHADQPDALVDMLAVLREAPAKWFAQAPRLLDRLDRTDLLLRAVQSAQLRGQAFALKTPLQAALSSAQVSGVVLQTLAAAPMQTAVFAASALQAVSTRPAALLVAAMPLKAAITQVQTRQQQAVLETRQLSLNVNAAALASLSWQGARAQAEQIVSLGDLIDGGHGRGEVARQAAETFDRMSRIAGCLHAEFSAVLPSIRLDWAERLSQFDQAPSLRDLSVLARWQEIGYADRRQMQAYVDWLFDQIDAREPRAEDLVNDVVRMCLLLAADAPIGRILAGRLPRPAVVRPGVRLPLTAFDPSKLRVGMQALIYRGADVVARAVVEDIGSEISARVVQTQTAELSLDITARVQFAETAQVSLKQAPVKMALGKALVF